MTFTLQNPSLTRAALAEFYGETSWLLTCRLNYHVQDFWGSLAGGLKFNVMCMKGKLKRAKDVKFLQIDKKNSYDMVWSCRSKEGVVGGKKNAF